MTQPNDTPTSAPVSTVTKHIKIYSDNPIHDCIDRIIDAVAGLDHDNDISYYASQLMMLSEKLHRAATT
jgi:tagatose-1,6-bisphosphate aldolase non-catalytic subunit AgaZ/GatZ